MKRMGLRLKKVTPHASERDRGKKNRRRREEFVERLRAIPPEKLIFLVDESGVTTRMTRLYARALGGVRVHEGAPEGDWQILTILGAMSSRGMIAAMTIERRPQTGRYSSPFWDEVLCPALHPGDVVVMDNLSSHKVDGVRQRIESLSEQSCSICPPILPI